MSLRINDIAPDFKAATTQGEMHFHEWIDNSWAILFSHPKDFTPVCTTELGTVAHLMPEFDRRNCKVVGLSIDPVDKHAEWARDILETQGAAVNFPMIGDSDLAVAKAYDMFPTDITGTSEGRTAATNATVRSVHIIGPDKRVKLIMTYPMSTGRNFDEILRVIDSLQLAERHQIVTPVNWTNGNEVIIDPDVSDDEANRKFPGGFRKVKSYLRFINQPK